jgi:hypothetical protein
MKCQGERGASGRPASGGKTIGDSLNHCYYVRPVYTIMAVLNLHPTQNSVRLRALVSNLKLNGFGWRNKILPAMPSKTVRC